LSRAEGIPVQRGNSLVTIASHASDLPSLLSPLSTPLADTLVPFYTAETHGFYGYIFADLISKKSYYQAGEIPPPFVPRLPAGASLPPAPSARMASWSKSSLSTNFTPN